MLDTIDKLTEPTACSLFDGTRNNVELALAKVFHFKKLAIQYRCRMGMLWCNLLMCEPMRVTTLCLYQLMGVIYNPSCGSHSKNLMDKGHDPYTTHDETSQP
jgi:hypothetical protein